jgi:hypothetical protein
MVPELYRLYQQLLEHIPNSLNYLQEDTILADLVGNRLLVESTNNTIAEILARISKGKTPIRCGWMLQKFINRQASHEWQSATSLSPFHQEQSPEPKEASMRFIKDSVDWGLLLLLGLGQLMGMEVQKDLVTTFNVVQLLQPMLGKSYVQLFNGGVLWNDNQLMDTMCPRSFGFSSLSNLFLTLTRSPLETHNHSWNRLKPKI